MGYHKVEIKKGIYGEFSKIIEEVDELTDAVEQDDKILQICELSDLIGAIEQYSESKFGLSLVDLKKFSDKTKSAFKEKKRQ
jgi:NTP pyrophosphatase (non-canonical NTP hydrolase)